MNVSTTETMRWQMVRASNGQCPARRNDVRGVDKRHSRVQSKGHRVVTGTEHQRWWAMAKVPHTCVNAGASRNRAPPPPRQLRVGNTFVPAFRLRCCRAADGSGGDSYNL